MVRGGVERLTSVRLVWISAPAEAEPSHRLTLMSRPASLLFYRNAGEENAHSGFARYDAQIAVSVGEVGSP